MDIDVASYLDSAHGTMSELKDGIYWVYGGAIDRAAEEVLAGDQAVAFVEAEPKPQSAVKARAVFGATPSSSAGRGAERPWSPVAETRLSNGEP
jgi:hypothetical protein